MDRTRTALWLTVLALALPASVSAQAPRPAAADTVQPAPADMAHPAPIAASRTPAAPAQRAPATPAQALRVGDVLIEGKLYSPQALFILSRSEEHFGRDVVVPHVLQMQRATTLMPYRLRPEVLAAQRQALDAATNSTPAPIVPRRSP